MEAAAVAWSADLFGCPTFCIKSVTDIVDGDRPAQVRRGRDWARAWWGGRGGNHSRRDCTQRSAPSVGHALCARSTAPPLRRVRHSRSWRGNPAQPCVPGPAGGVSGEPAQGSRGAAAHGAARGGVHRRQASQSAVSGIAACCPAPPALCLASSSRLQGMPPRKLPRASSRCGG